MSVKKTKEICIFLLVSLLLLSIFHLVRDIINKDNPRNANILENKTVPK